LPFKVIIKNAIKKNIGVGGEGVSVGFGFPLKSKYSMTLHAMASSLVKLDV
jgi:hypothetical protein